MRSAVITVLLLAAYCEARPSFDFDARPFFGSSYIIGGVNADVGEFPWQLSQQRCGGASCSHSCGASLLSSRYALSAAHCIDGASVTSLRIVAGVLDRTDPNGVASPVASYKIHENWYVGLGSYPNDIGIITLATPIEANGLTIKYAELPADNTNQFVGKIGFVSGWGRNGPSNSLPLILQKASIGVIATDRCNELLKPYGSVSVSDFHICLLDSANITGSCNGDSGGPFNINAVYDGAEKTVVAGVTSWSIKDAYAKCLKSYPSVYTRVSAYVDWIKTNTP